MATPDRTVPDATVDIPPALVEEVAVRLLRFTLDEAEDDYARDIIRLVLREYRLL